jgi:hypothetical protein
MQIRSLKDAQTLRQTIITVDREISRRRRAIRRNLVPNAGIARDHVQAMLRDNERRKAILHMNRNEIIAMQEAGSRFTPLRNSFITPDGPRNRGNRTESRKQRQARREPSKKTRRTISRPVTKKQLKRQSAPPVDVTPPPPRMIIQPAKPPNQAVAKVADAIRHDTHVLGKEKAKAITRAKDAQRDAELVKRGQSKLVDLRKKREAEEEMKKAKLSIVNNRNKVINEMKQRASKSVVNARSDASRLANRAVRSSRISKARFQPMRRGSSGTGLAPHLKLKISLSDRQRAATINQSTRSPSKAPRGPIKDQITEDVRQHKPIKKAISSEERHQREQIREAGLFGRRMIAEGLKGRGEFGSAAKALGPNRAQYWAKRGYALIAQLETLVNNEFTRWKQGALNTGVAISTDTRSQSKREMTYMEFQQHVKQKAMPMVMPFINEFQQEVHRAQVAHSSRLQPKTEKRVLDNSLAVSRQKSLATADKLRGHGRPVLSEQQGTKGLAGLFPALRSSMQGALRR